MFKYTIKIFHAVKFDAFLKCMNVSKLKISTDFFSNPKLCYLDSCLYFNFMSGSSCLHCGIRFNASLWKSLFYLYGREAVLHWNTAEKERGFCLTLLTWEATLESNLFLTGARTLPHSTAPRAGLGTRALSSWFISGSCWSLQIMLGGDLSSHGLKGFVLANPVEVIFFFGTSRGWWTSTTFYFYSNKNKW